MSILPPDPRTLKLYDALRHSSAVIPLPGRTQIEITGADRTTFLNGFCTGDVKKLRPGQGCEAFITNHQGKAVGHVLIFCEEDCLLLDGAPGIPGNESSQAETIIKHLDRFVISERVEFHDRTADWNDLLIAGPRAEEQLRRFPLETFPAERWQQERLSFYSHISRFRRGDLLGPTPTFLISAVRQESWMYAKHLLDVGAVIDEEHSAAAWEMARIEAGYPLFGRDITDDNLPQEVNRNDQAINFNKGCYLGQETIARLDALGHVNRILTGLKLPLETTLQPGDVVQQGEKKIAQITSIAYSPKLEQPLALAYVRAIHATPGKRFAVAGGEAEVVALPLP